MPKSSTISFGPWAPDFPSFGGNTLGGGGSIILEDAKGVYPTLGGYRPLTKPGTAAATFAASDFATVYTPNNMGATPAAQLWLDGSDLSTKTLVDPAKGTWPTFITQWDDKLTGSSLYAEDIAALTGSLSGFYIAFKHAAFPSQYLLTDPKVEGYWPLCVGNYDYDDGSVAGYANGGGMDVNLGSSYTGTTLWCLIVHSENYLGLNDSPENVVLVEFGNDGEVAESNADSCVIRKDGTSYNLAVVRSGETDADGDTYTRRQIVMTTVVFDGATKTIRTNGAESDSQTSTTAFDISRIRLGARGDVEDNIVSSGGGNTAADFSWSGGIYCFVYGTGTLTSDDIEKLEGAIAHQYGITDILDSAHTYKSEEPQSPASVVGGNEPTSHSLNWSGNGTPFFFVGDYAKIWLFDQAGEDFNDVSNASTSYAASRELPWQFAQFGNYVVGVTKNTAPQVYQLGVSTLFADLAGSPPKARTVAQVRDFLMLGSIVSGSNEYQYRVQWSAFNDIEDWTVDPGGTQADYQDLEAQYGEVMAIVGGEYATIFQQRAITRMTYVGPPAIFQRDTVEINRGTIAPLSVIQIGNLIYYYSHDGFWAFNGAQSQRISGDQINRWVKNRISDSSAHDMRVDHDPDRRIIMWAWPYDPDGLNRTTSGLQLIFNYDSGQWSYNVDTDKRWWIVRAPPVVDYIDSGDDYIDDYNTFTDTESAGFGRTMSLNYDGEFWRLSSLDGGDTEATLETTKFTVNPGMRSFVNGGRVIGNIDSTSAITVAVTSTPAYPTNTLSAEASAERYNHNSVNDGFFAVRSEGRFHGVQVVWDGGIGTTTGNLEELNVVQGVVLDYENLGKF